MADKILLAQQMKRFMQMQVQAANLDDDKAMEVADLTGDIVSHNDQLWISTTDGNVWEPGIYGWEVYEQ